MANGTAGDSENVFSDESKLKHFPIEFHLYYVIIPRRCSASSRGGTGSTAADVLCVPGNVCEIAKKENFNYWKAEGMRPFCECFLFS